MTPETALPQPTGLPVQCLPGKPPVLRTPRLAGQASARAWVVEHTEAIRTELLRHGHLLIRGLPIERQEHFADLRDVLVRQRAAYREKATPRSDFGADVYSSTDLPPVQPIRQHNENSYTLDFPGLLLFCCLDAPDTGGATTVADVRQVLKALPAGLVERFRATGWLLNRNYHAHAGLPWQTAFSTDEREDVAEYCERNLIGHSWQGEAGLRTVQRRSALVRHPRTHEEVWFNHAAFWSRWSLDKDIRDVMEMTFGTDGLPFDTAFGDGSALTAQDVDALNEAYDSATRRESWQPGDLMLVDNILSAHGRDAYRGSRRILVAMGEPVALRDSSPTVSPAPGPLT
ncbi:MULTISPECIES: TauD/TfdA family dioxygenase [unclassified Streptomyces]|uniref:TauD/TfdA family dioxygenase n=1 Tax=unclassified Streptomyces TaxID=2593676 RepID=UPI0037FBDB88